MPAPIKDYHWVVDVAGLGGAIVGGALGGPVGAVVGGALAATLAVPLRRYLAERTNKEALQNDFSLPAEMGVTAGASLLFGGVFLGAATVARLASTRLTAAVAARAARVAARPGLAKAVVEKGWEPLKKVYVGGGHVALRGAAGGIMAYDLTHDKNGKWNPADDSLDTGLGFVASIYSLNLVYSKFFGANLFGLDTTAPMSIATYQLIRIIAGAKPFDLGEFNYNEASRFRYMNEFANIIQNTATYGRAYLRPDLRQAIAAARGLKASSKTGTEKVSPFGWLLDHTFGAAYRAMPQAFKKVVRPTIHYPVGPLFKSKGEPGSFSRKVAERVTVLKGFKGNDMMKPDFGPAGRVVSLLQVWGLVVPYQFFAAPLLGMKGGQWGAHRFLKFTFWPLIGNPIQAGAGGDTAFAKLVGFSVGMVMDTGITLFYNPRFQKKEWEWDFHESLARFRQTEDAGEKNRIADHVLNDIFFRQMTDWDLKSLVAGRGLRKFNEDYLPTFQGVANSLTPADAAALEEIYQNRLAFEASPRLKKFGERISRTAL